MTKIPKRKPQEKPYKDYPLSWHPAGTWCKRIRGKLYYFGSNWQEALAKYLQQRDYLQAGLEPPPWPPSDQTQPATPEPEPQPAGLTVRALANHFLEARKERVASGVMAERTWEDYRTICKLIIDSDIRVDGASVADYLRDRLVETLTPDDLVRLRKVMAKRHPSPSALKKDITVAKMMFRYSVKLTGKPFNFGEDQEFAPPTAKQAREARNAKGELMFEPEQVQVMLANASKPLKAMILLGLNCGYGNHDCAMLPVKAIKDGWANFPRPKTAVPRRCPLWPETIAALKDVIRPGAERVFTTARGATWERVIKEVNGKRRDSCPISHEMGKLLKKLGIKGQGGFYSLRRTFETFGGDAKDQVAVDYIMGHYDPSMAAIYRQKIFNDRLEAVVNHVRAKLLLVDAKSEAA